MTKVLLISVGGSPNPIICSIDHQRPDYIIYFASKSSRPTIRKEIEPRLAHCPIDHEIIVTPDEQNLVESVEILLREVPRCLQLWNCTFEELTGDYTGGTKTMSAALVLALSGRGGKFSYVGGLERDKQGLGVVLDGHEQMLHLQNPWDVLAVESLRDTGLYFNRCRFQSIVDLADRTMRRVEEQRPLFEAIKAAAEGYYFWDNFHYEKGLNFLRQAESRFNVLASASGRQVLKDFLHALRLNVSHLERVKVELNLLVKSTSTKEKQKEAEAPADGRALLLDLLANAVRRAEVEFKFDDAVARLYSAVEKIAKTRLLVAHGIDNSDVDPAAIPDPKLAEELARECRNDREGKIQLPLHRSFELLHALGDEVGETYQRRQVELRKVLNIRNSSLLAHGYQPVTADTYQKLLAISLDFAGATREDLPVFPLMEWHNG